MKNNYEINKQMTFDQMRSIEIGRSKREISNRPNAVKHMRIDRTSLSRNTNLIFVQDINSIVKDLRC